MLAPHPVLLQSLAANANDSGPAIEVFADPASADGVQIKHLRDEDLPGFAQTMVVVRTSGSTGRAKRTVLSLTPAMPGSPSS